MPIPTTPEGAATPDPEPRYATFPRRLNALSVDALILIVFSVVVFSLLPSGAERPALRLSLAFLWWGTLLLYEPVMVTWFGGTLGHRLLNLRVVDDNTGGNPGLMKALGRFLIKGLLGVASFVSMSFARRHQALHDMMTRSTVQVRDPSKAAPHHYVLDREPPPPPGTT
jgi:uncharacterized RDD family membrane protein YckC